MSIDYQCLSSVSKKRYCAIETANSESVIELLECSIVALKRVHICARNKCGLVEARFEVRRS